MQEKFITVEIDENGNSSIDLEGFHGQGCGDVAKDFRGGEPMQQAPDLLDLIHLLKRARSDISIGIYSGYTERELDSGRFWTRYGIAQEARCRIWEDIKQELDFAVLGRFVAARPSKFPMRTSANQVLRLFSDRYREKHFKPLEFEVHIEAQGLTQITGFPLVGLPL